MTSHEILSKIQDILSQKHRHQSNLAEMLRCIYTVVSPMEMHRLLKYKLSDNHIEELLATMRAELEAVDRLGELLVHYTGLRPDTKESNVHSTVQ